MGNTSTTPTKAAESLIAETLEHPIAIFSKRTCGYCHAAKKLLSTESNALSTAGCRVPTPKIIELDDGTLPPATVQEVLRLLHERTGASTVPRVFISGHAVGGASDTARYAQSGGLRLALAAAAKCPP